VTAKLYCRLTRFRAALSSAAAESPNWAEAAAELGYADQSHMIAEFREFSSLTPARLLSERRFHPFVPDRESRS
jgi:AraC-like DNA-binding protein